jgi:poly(3-hydroxybutyrate) depolymerase
MHRRLVVLLSCSLACTRSAPPTVASSPHPPLSSGATTAAASAEPAAPLAPTASVLAASVPPTGSSYVPSSRRTSVLRQDWPCPGCLTRLPPTDDTLQPAPLLVVLHGDDGNTSWMDWIWHHATNQHNAVLLILRCPGAGGYGAPSWVRWLRSANHDPAWLAARIHDVEAHESIDSARIYASGYSSGGSYLSWYLTHAPPLFAAVSQVAGGTRQGTACPTCKTPLRFLVGSLDTMLASDIAPLRDWYQSCGGHEIVWDQREAMTHEGILWVVERGGADAILSWMLEHRKRC